MTKQEQLEMDVLEYAQLPKIPEEATDETPMWIYAIAKIRTFTLSVGYAVVRYSYGERPTIIKAFYEGGFSGIISIHPYKFFDKKYLPALENIGSVRSFVAKTYGVDKAEVAKLGKKELLKLVYNYCIKRQLCDENEEKRRKQAEIMRQASQVSMANTKETE